MSGITKHAELKQANDRTEAQCPFPENPCIALRLSRHYRSLADLSDDENARKSYNRNAATWLSFYIGHYSHSAKLQNQLNDFVLLYEFIC